MKRWVLLIALLALFAVLALIPLAKGYACVHQGGSSVCGGEVVP